MRLGRKREQVTSEAAELSSSDLSHIQLIRRLDQLEATVATLEANAREADGVIALLLGLLAEASGVELDVQPEDAPTTSREEWLGHLSERYLHGYSARTTLVTSPDLHPSLPPAVAMDSGAPQ